MKRVGNFVPFGTSVHIPYPMQHSIEHLGGNFIPELLPQHGNMKDTLHSKFCLVKDFRVCLWLLWVLTGPHHSSEAAENIRAKVPQAHAKKSKRSEKVSKVLEPLTRLIGKGIPLYKACTQGLREVIVF